MHMTVVSAYAPTRKATAVVKDRFFEDLQRTVDGVPASDLLLLLGDFNARVGSHDGNEWKDVLGRFGHGVRNDAGERLSVWCAANGLAIMNTHFRKPSAKQGTWTHPATKQQHLIDFVVMRQAQRRFCRDVSVMRGANCWTDHFLVRLKLRVDLPSPDVTRSTHRGSCLWPLISCQTLLFASGSPSALQTAYSINLILILLLLLTNGKP